jgi:hypothetical protein
MKSIPIILGLGLFAFICEVIYFTNKEYVYTHTIPEYEIEHGLYQLDEIPKHNRQILNWSLQTDCIINHCNWQQDFYEVSE